MDFATIEYFGYLSKYGNLSVAAKELHIDQSSLSRMLSSLEKEIGARLFDRSKSPMELTPEGEVALEYTCRITSAYAEMMIQIKRIREFGAKTVRISGLLESSLAGYVNEAIREFKANGTGIRIKPTTTGLENPFNALRNGKIDVLFEVFSEMTDIHDIESIPLHREQAFLVLDKDHPLASRNSLAVDDLRDITFLSNSKNTDYALRKHVQSLCRRHGFAGKLSARVTIYRSELFLSDFENMGMLLPASMVGSSGISNLDTFVAVPIEDEDADFDLRAFFSPIHEFRPTELIDYLRRCAVCKRPARKAGRAAISSDHTQEDAAWLYENP
jgi:DNA-binding transcriptional LysR family regulator